MHTLIFSSTNPIGLKPHRAFSAGFLVAVGLALPVVAQSGSDAPCGSYGGLAFLGRNADATAVFFLTAIRPPPFGFGDALELRHDATGTVVDAFSFPDPPGLRLSTSGFVAAGAEGSHTLYEQTQGDCAIATAFQEGGLVLPPGGGGGGSGGGSPDGNEPALLGTTTSPAFLRPYSITERLQAWGLPSSGTIAPKSGKRVWAQAESLSYDDDREGRDGSGRWSMLTLGADMVQRPDLILGFALGMETASTDAFDAAVSADFDGVVLGPYVAWRPRQDLLLDAWLGYASRNVETGILDLDSNYYASRVFLSLNATGRHALGKMEALPRLSLFLSHDDFDGHAYAGPSGSFEVAGGSDTVALLSLATELRHKLEPLADGTILIPAARFGIEAWLARPEDGAVYSGTLEIEETEAVTINFGAGLTALSPNGGRLDLSLDYMGDGNDLGGIEATLAYALRF